MSYYVGQHYLTAKVLKKVISDCKLKLKKVKFDTIAVRGTSGLLIGPSLAMALNKDLLIVRKPKESSHSSHRIEGIGTSQKIVLVDDFIASGETIRTMIKTIETHCITPEIIGILLYASVSKSKGFSLYANRSTGLSRISEAPLIPIYPIKPLRGDAFDF
jgi:adenine/guanine phosphoribosyltransferase-like PRPP-binding protein